MARWNTGKKNGMWKGGKSTASNGYVLVRVGSDHHLADSRGYAYEHRLVAEEMLGRHLQPGEIIHHLDGDRTNNSPSNLEVTGSIAEHMVFHRTENSCLQLPGEDNPIIKCLCGCGEEFYKYDTNGRPREYISGHNPQSSPTVDLILGALSDGEKTVSYLTEIHPSKSYQAIKGTVSKLAKRGIIRRIEKGVYSK